MICTPEIFLENADFVSVFFFCKNNKIVTEIIFLEFNRYKNYNTEKLQKNEKVAIKLGVGRPKAEIPRCKTLNLRLTNFEFEKIERIAKQKNLTKTEAILKGIDLLERDKPKKYANIKERQRKRREEWIKKGLKIYDDDNDDDD